MSIPDRWAVILMDGSPDPEPHAGWLIEGSEEEAEAFRAFVADEINPAVRIRLSSPVGELLRAWQAERARRRAGGAS